MALVVVLAFLVSGCASIAGPNAKASPETQLAMAREAFNATVNVLAELREQGRFTKDQARTVTGLVAAGDMALMLWEGALARGEPPDVPQARYYTAMADLVVIRRTVAGGNHGP